MPDTIKPRNISDELVERVARELRTFYSDEPVAVCDGVAFKAARAAIAVSLEEAARVADSYARTHEYKRQMFDDGEITTHTGRALVSPRAIAAAIRALFQKETPNA